MVARVCILLSLLVVAMCLPAIALPMSPPTWPRTFGLAPGEVATYGVPVLQPGDVVVDVSWTGTAPSVAIKDLGGKAVNAARQSGASGVKLSFSVTQGDVQQNKVWLVVITAPGTLKPTMAKGQPVVKGQISVQSPPVDEQALQALTVELTNKAKAGLNAVRANSLRQAPKPKPTQPAGVGVPLSTNDAKLLAQVKAGADEFYGSMMRKSETIKSKLVTTSSTGIIQTNRPKVDHGLPGDVKPRPELAPPQITSITPGSGGPGTQVTINANAVLADDKVHFTLMDNSAMPVAVSARTDTSVTVIIPSYNWAYTQTGIFHLQRDTASGAQYSNGVLFWLDATVPNITAMSPAQGMGGDTVLLEGTGLYEVHAVRFQPSQGQESKFFPSQQYPSADIELEILAKSDTQLLARLPDLGGVASSIEGRIGVQMSPNGTLFRYPATGFRLNPKMIVVPIYEPVHTAMSRFASANNDDGYAQVCTPQQAASNPLSGLQWLDGWHMAGYSFSAGLDTFYMNVKLKNGWTLDRAEVEHRGDGCAVRAGTPTGPNGEPGVSVYWMANIPGGFSAYSIWMHAKGPKGVPYK